MKCKHCDVKMIKISELTMKEIISFLNNNPLKRLDKLEKNGGVLVYYREIDGIINDELFNNKIQFRKVEKIEKNKLKLFGFKTLFPLDNPTVIYNERLVYTLIPMKDEYLDIIEKGLDKLGGNYSSTKLNNILTKSFMLKEFMINYDNYIENEVI